MREQTAEDKYIIDCSAPVFFFDVDLPSGRRYSRDVAEHICKLAEDEISIMTEIGGLQREIGMCYHAVIQENAVLGRLALHPRYKSLEDKWNMRDATFFPAIEMKKRPAPKTTFTMDEFVKLHHFVAELRP